MVEFGRIADLQFQEHGHRPRLGLVPIPFGDHDLGRLIVIEADEPVVPGENRVRIEMAIDGMDVGFDKAHRAAPVI